MRGWSMGVGVGVLAVGLACGGGGGGGGGWSGSAVGPYAASYATHMEATHEVPCATARVGQETKVGDWSIKLTEAKIIEPHRRRQYDVNPPLRDPEVKGLALHFSVRNDTPIKKDRLDLETATMGNDGVRLPYVSDATVPYRESIGYDASKPYSPATWVEMVWVMASKPETADGAVMWFAHQEERRDDRGRKYKVITEQACIDMGTPTPEGG